VRVLVIEDDDDLALCMQAVLEFSDVSVETAPDGQTALDRLRMTDDLYLPDLILLDLMMPGVDGWQFRWYQLLDPRLAGIPTILVTAVDRAESDAEAMSCTLLRKPFGADQLVAAIHRSGSVVRREVKTVAAGPSARKTGT